MKSKYPNSCEHKHCEWVRDIVKFTSLREDKCYLICKDCGKIIYDALKDYERRMWK
ncbi:hypothetical protein LH399_11000 [Fusobacterium nucleatum]